ncbi:HDL025Cp [Eremothecium sinecaudum]|uniref:HDL025Cp n=1 Tax=Eremothecium sinecaudum TaxID=45286 RepID=A0A0X8HSM8_9SACH|nr:HDL025Cp [Eremothecium sinecaudum]AMD20719.1 HDL025Cp [Eremothecium sinecaudum]
MSLTSDLLQDLSESEDDIVENNTAPGKIDDHGDTRTKLLQIIEKSNHPALDEEPLVDKLLAIEPEFRIWMDKNGFADLDLLNQLQPVILKEAQVIYNNITFTYADKFSELSTIISDRNQYIRVLQELEKNPKAPNLDLILSKEQCLLVSMAMKTGFRADQKIDISYTYGIIDKHLILDKLHEDIVSFISKQIRNVAPNVCALVGEHIAAKLLASTGGIKGLSEVPSCNLASIGKPKYLSHLQQVDASRVRQQGHIFSSPLVQDQVLSFQKQAVRMLCAKVSLAARVDYSQRGEVGDDSLGRKWQEEILEKLLKLQDPPNTSKIKPLPVPQENVKKKRAGRRFRKYKEKFQLSHLRQLQNRVEFGAKEQVKLDAFGEEIGLGMAIGTVVTSAVSSGNTAKVRKQMKQRVEKARQDTGVFWDLYAGPNLGQQSREAPNKNNSDVNSPKDVKNALTDSNWYFRHLK